MTLEFQCQPLSPPPQRQHAIPADHQQAEPPLEDVLPTVFRKGIRDGEPRHDIGDAQHQHRHRDPRHPRDDARWQCLHARRATHQRQLREIAEAEVYDHAVAAKETIGLAFGTEKCGVDRQRHGRHRAQGEHQPASAQPMPGQPPHQRMQHRTRDHQHPEEMVSQPVAGRATDRDAALHVRHAGRHVACLDRQQVGRMSRDQEQHRDQQRQRPKG